MDNLDFNKILNIESPFIQENYHPSTYEIINNTVSWYRDGIRVSTNNMRKLIKYFYNKGILNNVDAIKFFDYLSFEESLDILSKISDENILNYNSRLPFTINDDVNKIIVDRYISVGIDINDLMSIAPNSVRGYLISTLPKEDLTEWFQKQERRMRLLKHK